MIDTITDPCLDANDGVFRQRFDDLQPDVCDLIAAHGYDPARVMAVAYDVVDAPMLRMQVYLDDEDGLPALDETGDSLASEWYDTLLRTDLPT